MVEGMQVTIVTEGDPDRMSGGFLYHRRVADRAGDHGASVRFASVPQRPFPLAVVDGPAVMRTAVAGADVVVVDSLASNTLGPWLAVGLGRRVPIVGSVHQGLGGMDVGRLRRAVQTRSDRAAWRRATHLIVASEMLAAELADDGLSLDAMTVVPPGRDVPLGDPATIVGPDLDLRRGRRVALLCVGNWLARKGIIEVLDAVASMPERSATLHLVGDEDVDGAYRRRVLERLGRADLGGRVVRHDIVDPGSMRSIYAAADAFVLASTVEPYGTVYGEAMAAGLPVVGWSAGNLPHLATDGVEGRVVPIGDIAGLAAALADLATDGARRARMGEAALARSEKLPTWDETAERFVAVCRRAAALHP
jgi:glycosyltransferase involved in cell wall biosynthesis